MTDPRYPEPPPVPLAPPVNRIGRAALIVGIVLVGVELVTRVVSVIVPILLARSGAGYGATSALFLAFNVVELLIAAVAAVLGLIGLSRPGLPRGAAAAGAALGLSTVVLVLLSLASSPIASLVLR